MKKDNFESIIKNKLDEAGKQPEAWNTPPPMVFDNAMATVNQKLNRRKRGFILPVVALLLLSAGAIYLWSTMDSTLEAYQSNETHQIDSQAISNKITTSAVASVSNNNASATQQKNNTSQELVKNKADKTIQNKLVPSKKIIKNTPTNDPKENVVRNSANPNQQIIATVKKDGKDALADATLSTGIASANDKNAENKNLYNQKSIDQAVTKLSAFNLATLDLKPFDVEEADVTSLTLAQADIGPKESFQPYSTIGVSGMILGSKNICSGISQEMVPGDRHEPSYGFNLNFERTINEKWSWGSMLSWSRLNSNASSSSTSIYDAENETLENGITYYNTPMDVQTPFGIFSSTALFPIDPTTIQPNDAINFESTMGQQLETVAINLLGKRYFGNSDRFRIFVGSNIGYNHILNLRSDMDMKIEMHDAVMMEKKEIMEDKFDLKNGFVTIGLQTGIEKRITQNTFMTFSVGGSQSITSLRKNTATNLSINQLNASIGIARSFGN